MENRKFTICIPLMYFYSGVSRTNSNSRVNFEKWENDQSSLFPAHGIMAVVKENGISKDFINLYHNAEMAFLNS